MASILIVDDSLSMRELLRQTLQGAGHKVEAGENGAEGLELAQKGNFQVVITDINMPVMDGFRLLEKLRALPEYKFKPILILTTESSQEMKMRGKAAGATGWLVKPFDPQKLLDVITRVLG